MTEEKWILVSYEKLPDFCYNWGRVGHIVQECDEVDDDGEGGKNLGFGLENHIVVGA